MNRAASSRMLAVALPAAAVATIVVALLGTVGAVPRIPIASEVVGLVAVLLAPGLAVEPAFRGNRWTPVERLGLASALSVALSALLGVGLHLAGLPVTPANVLALLLLVAATAGALSVRFRFGRPARPLPRRMRPEIIVGVGSLVLLAAGFAAILVLRPSPGGPALEIMAVDGADRLVTMPIRSSTGGTTVTIAIRSASSANGSASLAVGGDGIVPWSVPDVAIGTQWSSVNVPIRTTRTGQLVARVTATSGSTQLTIPIAMDVAP